MRRIILITTAGLVLWYNSLDIARAQTTQTYRAVWADNSSNEKGFKLYLIGGTLAQWVVRCTVPANTKQCDFTENDQIPRCYAVVAFNDAGDSVPVGPSCIGTPALPGSFSVTPVTGTPALPPG